MHILTAKTGKLLMVSSTQTKQSEIESNPREKWGGKDTDFSQVQRSSFSALFPAKTVWANWQWTFASESTTQTEQTHKLQDGDKSLPLH